LLKWGVEPGSGGHVLQAWTDALESVGRGIALVAVPAVVPGKECLAVAEGVFEAAKAIGEVGALFHGLEL